MYAYCFKRDLPGGEAGAFHSAELWYTFGSIEHYNYSRPDLHFILDSGWISKDAETLTLQVYGYIDQEEDTGKITGETDGEIISESYHEYLEEAPEDMAEPIGEIFEISILG